MQWNKRGWGKGPRAAYRFLDLRRACRGPLVVTLHDVFDRDAAASAGWTPDTWSLRLVARSADRLIVHSEVEVERLAGIVPAAKLRVVPALRRGAAPAALRGGGAGAPGRRRAADRDAAGLHLRPQGPRRPGGGHPRSAAGRARGVRGRRRGGREGLMRRVQQRVAELGLEDRVRITGYLSEEEMETWIAASHLAVLPFRDLSASGSLSTWIAAGKPILASDLPGFHEYDRRVPGAIRFLGSLDPAALARSASWTRSRAARRTPIRGSSSCATHLTVPRTADRYLDVLREAAQGA